MRDRGMFCAFSVTKGISENIKHKNGQGSSGNNDFDNLIGQKVYFGKRINAYANDTDGLTDVEWIVTEKLDNGVYALQSTGVSAGCWPGFVATGSTYYNCNYAYKNIAFMSSDWRTAYDYKANLLYLYDQIRNTEADGGRIDDETDFEEGLIWVGRDNLRYKIGIGKYVPGAEKDGLYLVSATEKNDGFFGAIADIYGESTTDKGNHYHYALYLAAKNYKSFNAAYSRAWMGSVQSSGYAWYVNSSGETSCGYSQNDFCVLAPAFNLDVSKIDLEYIDGKPYITPKFQPALRIGEEYTMGTYKTASGSSQSVKWICTERLDDNVYVMQSEGISAGQWPGYVSSGYSAGDFAYRNISALSTSNDYDKMGNLKAFYDEYGGANHVEANGGRDSETGEWKDISATNNGLYLIPSNLISSYGRYYYLYTFKKTFEIYSAYVSFGASSSNRAWLGSAYNNSSNSNDHSSALCIGNKGSTTNYQKTYNMVLAPAFNLDITKVNINGNVITKK